MYSALKRPTLARSLRVQVRVVHALLMREIITRYGRHNIGFMWLFIEPMIFTIGVGYIWSATKVMHGAEVSPIIFALTGYTVLLMWRNVASRCMRAIEPNLPLMYHRNVKLIDVLLARIILEIFGATCSFLVLAGLFISLGLTPIPQDPIKLILGWLFLAWFCFALGIFVGGLSELSEVLERMWHIFVYLMFPFSGAVFLVDWIPSQYRELILLIPMVDITELVRDGYWGVAINAHYNILYLIIFNLILTLAALSILKFISNRLEVE